MQKRDYNYLVALLGQILGERFYSYYLTPFSPNLSPFFFKREVIYEQCCFVAGLCPEDHFDVKGVSCTPNCTESDSGDTESLVTTSSPTPSRVPESTKAFTPVLKNQENQNKSSTFILLPPVPTRVSKRHANNDGGPADDNQPSKKHRKCRSKGSAVFIIDQQKQIECFVRFVEHGLESSLTI